MLITADDSGFTSSPGAAKEASAVATRVRMAMRCFIWVWLLVSTQEHLRDCRRSWVNFQNQTLSKIFTVLYYTINSHLSSTIKIPTN